MRLAIMQPYLFPYVGYFQLIASVQKFVVYDDVAFIKNGWINRNRILTAQGVEYFTVPLAGASSFQPIFDTAIVPVARWRDKLLRKFEQNYARSQQRDVGMAMVEHVFAEPAESIRDLAVSSIKEVCRYAELTPEFIETSRVYGNSSLSGSERVIDICKREGADHYLNASGGKELYHAGEFVDQGLKLTFVGPRFLPYAQPHSPTFVPGLSVIDLVMNAPRETVIDSLASGSIE